MTLIKLDDAIDALAELTKKFGTQWQAKRGVRFARGYIQTLPTIEIVRCKECKHYNYNDLHGWYECYRDFGLMEEVKPDYFCSYGERTEE